MIEPPNTAYRFTWVRRGLACCAAVILAAGCEVGSDSAALVQRAEASRDNLLDRLGALIEGDEILGSLEVLSLTPGPDLEGWYVWIEGLGRDDDPDGLVRVEEGEIHVLDVPETEEGVPFGYLATDVEYSDYILRLQYRWGSKTFAPRKGARRDSGLLYHLPEGREDQIWPFSVEMQIQEEDTGDFHLLWGGDHPSFETTHEGQSYHPQGERARWQSRLIRSDLFEYSRDWNQVELVVRGASGVHGVNGQVNNRGFNMVDGSGSPLRSGRIALQIEGAEIIYRNLELISLSRENRPARVLVFTGTAGFRHASIEAGVQAIRDLGKEHGFLVAQSQDPAVMMDMFLAPFEAVVLLSTTGDFLNTQQQAALEQFVRSGGGVASIHGAADAEYEWPWYGELIGAWFDRHSAVQEGLLRVEDAGHGSTEGLADPWTWTEEWYDFRTNPRDDVNVLLTLDERSYQSGGMGEDHPVAWYREFDGGRTWYTALGHEPQAFGDPDFRRHLLGGIRYAIGGWE